ncbi:MAG: VIT domain-containing protein [Spirochaetia bacterium]
MKLPAGLFNTVSKKLVALKEVRINTEMNDISSHTTITQVFENTEDAEIEALYCFPIEEGAAVCGFEIITENRKITGKIEERKKAFEAYDEAIENGDTSFILDQENKDILTVSAGNLAPGQKAEVKIQYIAELSVTDNTVRLQIPSSVSPRYSPPSEAPEKTEAISPEYTLDTPYRLSLEVRVDMPKIQNIQSPSHAIIIDDDDRPSVVTLQEEDTKLDRDFILEIQCGSDNTPVALASVHENGEQALLFRFFPDLKEIPEAKQEKEIIFLLDCSGSMSGTSIAEARKALELAFRSMEIGTFFNIICFGSRFELFAESSLEYTEESFEKALTYIQEIGADLGGTELEAPVKYLCSLPAKEEGIRDIILLTDGQISNPDAVIRQVAKAQHKLRVFTFGIGYGASSYLVKGMARAGRGACEMIQPGEKIHEKVLRQLSRINQPYLTNVSIKLENGSMEGPISIPPLFDKNSFSLFAKIHDTAENAEITLSGTAGGKEYSYSGNIQFLGTNNTIPALWALSKIREIKEQKPGGSNQTARKQKKIEKQITQLGLDYNLLTDYTSFVAVQERTGDEKLSGSPELRKIPVQITSGWHGIESVSTMLPPVQAFETTFSAQSPQKQRKKMFKKGFFGFSGKEDVETMETSFSENFPAAPAPPQQPEQPQTEEEWYFRLLNTQQAPGCFTGIDVLAEKLDTSREEITKAAESIHRENPELAVKILATILAIRLLQKDAQALAVSKPAITKAEKWLEKNAPDATLKDIEKLFPKLT